MPGYKVSLGFRVFKPDKLLISCIFFVKFKPKTKKFSIKLKCDHFVSVSDESSWVKMRQVLYFLLLLVSVGAAAAQDPTTAEETTTPQAGRKKNLKPKEEKMTKEEKKLLRKAEKEKSPSSEDLPQDQGKHKHKG